MSRVKSKSGAEICGDCSATDPAWASINRGIFLCSDCCSIHRSLGRHVSIIKSLRQGTWTPSVLNFVNQLNSQGANSVWEHTLLDTPTKHTKPKPTSKDSLQTKAEFIRAKHVRLAYVLKPSLSTSGGSNNSKDTSDIIEELSKQLHASVRADNLQTSLRLIVQGADVNYYSPEKGSTCLHVAGRFGQANQAELLIIYGADLTALDSQGHSAVELAKLNNFTILADRLLEATYEVTDRLSHFLCGKKPDHSAGKNFLIPQSGKSEMNEQLKIARGKLQLVPNRMFEELVMDLYEEVDRREVEATWATSALNPEIGAVPFLPTNPHLSATRNQGRQKLARFSQQEFAGLLTDVLEDSRRRQNMASLRPLDPLDPATVSDDDEPLYDAVCSDDYSDYAALAPTQQQQNLPNKSLAANQHPELDVLKQELHKSKLTIDELRDLVVKLSTENNELKAQISHEVDSNGVPINIDDDKVQLRRPVSMYEARRTPIKDVSPVPNTQSFHTSPPNATTLMPLFLDVNKRTDIITRRIQELWKTMQEFSRDPGVFVPCSERLHLAVMDLNTIFPAIIAQEAVKNSLHLINVNSHRMQRICSDLQLSILACDEPQIELFFQEVRNCAYDLAMATKALITQLSR